MGVARRMARNGLKEGDLKKNVRDQGNRSEAIGRVEKLVIGGRPFTSRGKEVKEKNAAGTRCVT